MWLSIIGRRVIYDKRQILHLPILAEPSPTNPDGIDKAHLDLIWKTGFFSRLPGHILPPPPTVPKMDPPQQRALSALEPYILLSKSANSPRAAADLITQATSSPNTYVFAELLWTSNIQALKQAEEPWDRYVRLLEIFCWGTWRDYEG